VLTFALVLGLSAEIIPTAMAIETSQNTTPTVSKETTSSPSSVAPVTVVTAAAACEIGSIRYATLQDAINSVPTNTSTTIKLLQNISITSGLRIKGKVITFDLSGFDLAVSNSADYGLNLTDSIVSYKNPGSFIVFATDNGMALNVDGGSCKLTGVAGDGGGIDSTGGATVVVNGNITAGGGTVINFVCEA